MKSFIFFISVLAMLIPSTFIFAESAPVTPPSVDESALDTSVKPCDDFYRFACGGWLKTAEIPPDRPAWSRGFVSVAEHNLAILRGLLENNGKKLDPEDKDSKKLGDYYSVCMDEKKAETASLATLKQRQKEIDALKDLKQLAPLLAKLHLSGADVFFGVDSFQDFKDSSIMIAAVDQGGLGLPDRDYYLVNEGKMPEIRKLYQEHMINMFKLVKVSAANAKKNTDTIFALEKSLAESSMARVDRRDPENIYHRLERKGLKEKAPSFDWDKYFAALGYPDVQQINVLSPDFFAAFEKLITSIPLADIKTYLHWHLLEASTNALGKAFVNERFHFTSKALGGEKEILPRWKRCVKAADGALAHPLGRAFVKVNFGATGKDEARALIENIEAAMETQLKDLSWMDSNTRKEALDKLKKVANQIGFPDKWRNYDALEIKTDSYLANQIRANQFNIKYELDKIGKPVDRLEWGMSAPTVNAYYSGDNNKMVFPAGILQPPYFHRDAPLAANYGGIGMVMGHELTHGFDDEGRKFDAKGNLRDWWTASVVKEFNSRTACMANQYSGYVPVDNLHINGKLTLGENIADQGGLKLAYSAYQTARKKIGDKATGKTAPYNDEQQFFIAFAQTWCSKQRPELQRKLITTDPHSPAEFRVNGAISNFPEFGKVFSCPSGSKMLPKSCAVW